MGYKEKPETIEGIWAEVSVVGKITIYLLAIAAFIFILVLLGIAVGLIHLLWLPGIVFVYLVIGLLYMAVLGILDHEGVI